MKLSQCISHIQNLTLRLILRIGADKDAFLRPHRAPQIGTQFKPFPALLFSGIHQMTQIQLALAAILGADLDMLLAALVVEADFVVRRGSEDVTLVVLDGHMVGVRRVVFYPGDIRPVRVAFLKRDADFRSRQQRQVQTVGVSRIRARLAYPQALIARFPRVTVKVEVDPVAPVLVDMGINIVLHRAGDPRRERAGHYGTWDKRRAVAVAL